MVVECSLCVIAGPFYVETPIALDTTTVITTLVVLYGVTPVVPLLLAFPTMFGCNPTSVSHDRLGIA
jgi:hypothetical protein